LNNPLAVISGRAQMAKGLMHDPEPLRALEIVEEQCNRATAIVRDLMRFAKPETPNPESIRVREGLERLCQYWRKRFQLSSDRLCAHVADQSAAIFVDPVQWGEALTEIIANAVFACRPDNTRIQINSESRRSDDTIRITIEDNGTGMSNEVLVHAADPFFSNRPAGRGRGLGLSLAVRLIEINGGTLRLDSIRGTGTSVTIELPSRAEET